MKFHRCELQVVYDQLDQIDAEKRCLSWRTADGRSPTGVYYGSLHFVDTIRNYEQLVGGLEHGFYDFPYIGNFITPTDELIFFRGAGQPPTRQQRFAFDRNGDPAKTGKSEQRKHFV